MVMDMKEESLHLYLPVISNFWNLKNLQGIFRSFRKEEKKKG